jgi:RHS repeat-associated protein
LPAPPSRSTAARTRSSEWVFGYENTTSRLKRITDAKGQHKDYTYFLDNNLQGLSFPNPERPTPNVSFTFDSAYNRVATMVDGTGTTTYGYHHITSPPQLGAGQLASVDGPLSNDVITYSYDELGRMLSRAVNGVTLTYAYDLLGRIMSETNVLGGFNYQYDGVTNRVLALNYPNGQITTYAYYGNSGDHQLQEIHHKNVGGATISKFIYSYDAVGSIKTWTQQTDTNAPKAYDLEYDWASRLRSATWRTTDPTPTILKRYVYTYDPAGNRTVEQIDNAPVLSAYDNENRMTSQAPGGTIRVAGTLNEVATVTIQSLPATVTSDNRFEGRAQVSQGTNQFVVKARDYAGNERTNTYEVAVSGTTKTFTYDINGNLTGDGTRTFEWDAENRLLAVNEGTLRSEFAYDGTGNRVRIVEKDNGQVLADRSLLYCGSALCEERDGGGTTRRFFAWGVREGADDLHYFRDHQRSIRELVDDSGTIRARYEYDPFGRSTKLLGDRDSVLSYSGLFSHTRVGLLLAPSRAYEEDWGRWLSPDPAGLEAGPNLYEYVGNSPVTYIDPTGRAQVSVSGPNWHPMPDRMDVIKACDRGPYVFGCTITEGSVDCDCEKEATCRYRPQVRASATIDVYYFDNRTPGALVTGALIRAEERKHVDAVLAAFHHLETEAEKLEQTLYYSKWQCELACEVFELVWTGALNALDFFTHWSDPHPY